MPDVTDEALALTIPCPLTACLAARGKRCVSFVTGRPLAAPHRQRVEAARKEALW